MPVIESDHSTSFPSRLQHPPMGVFSSQELGVEYVASERKEHVNSSHSRKTSDTPFADSSCPWQTRRHIRTHFPRSARSHHRPADGVVPFTHRVWASEHEKYLFVVPDALVYLSHI